MNRYVVLTGIDLIELIKEVNKSIGKGWEPLGGICTESSLNIVVYLQAMLLKKPPEQP